MIASGSRSRRAARGLEHPPLDEEREGDQGGGQRGRRLDAEQGRGAQPGCDGREDAAGPQGLQQEDEERGDQRDAHGEGQHRSAPERS